MISPVTPLTGPPAAARAGADLRAARERLGLLLDDVALNLRIRQPHLEALEEGHISLLPGNAYALAFVRTYASALGLDPEEMVRRFRTEASEFARRTELVFPVPMPERSVPPGAVLLLGLVLAIGAYAGWYRLSGEGRLPAETVTAIPERLAPLAQQTVPPSHGSPIAGPVLAGGPTPDLPITVVPTPGAIAPTSGAAVSRIVPADAATSEMLASVAPPVMAISAISAAAAQLPARSADDPAVASLPQASVASASPALDSGRIVLRANAEAWLSVKDRGGAVLLNRTLKAGETWSAPLRPDLVLTTGNAGGTEILVDGATTPSLGGSGVVRRDMALDPDQIKDGKLAGALVPQLASTHPRQ